MMQLTRDLPIVDRRGRPVMWLRKGECLASATDVTTAATRTVLAEVNARVRGGR